MPSQNSPESFQIGPLCLPLLKLSYATVPDGNVSPIPWTHLSSKTDLFAIFDTVRTEDSHGRVSIQRVFKVVKEPHVMENLDLDRLAEAAQSSREEAKNPASRDRTLKVAIVVQAPAIAIRYPYSHDQVRRFQVRFAEEEHYYEAMKMFARAKIPTEEAGSLATRSRPTTAQSVTSSTSLVPNDSASQIGARPISASSAYPSWPLAHERSQQGGPLSVAAGSTMIEARNLGPMPESATLPAPSASLHMPAHASPYFSQVDSPLAANVQSTQAGSEAQHGLASRATELLAKPGHSKLALNSGPVISVSETRIPMNLTRTPATPSLVKESQHLSQMLPPRRDLPFTKPESKQSTTDMHRINGHALTVDEEAGNADPQNNAIEKPRDTASATAKKRNRQPTRKGDEGTFDEMSDSPSWSVR